eukprot:COSAG02_NODE_50_length_44860_cov_203.992739_31_plen_97_part_00
MRDVCGCSLHVYRLCMRRHRARPAATWRRDTISRARPAAAVWWRKPESQGTAPKTAQVRLHVPGSLSQARLGDCAACSLGSHAIFVPRTESLSVVN